MATGARYKVQFRRTIAGKTDYRARKQLLISRKPRLVVRKSSKHMNVQLIVDGKEGDNTLISANTTELKKYGYAGGTGNLPSAYLAGLLLGYRAKKKGHSDAILDLGLYHATKGGRIYAALKGAVDSGLEIPHNPEILPGEDRISGKHIDKYRKSDISAQFESAKKKIQDSSGE